MTVPIPRQNGDRTRVERLRVRRETRSGTVRRAGSGALDRADPRPAGGPASAVLIVRGLADLLPVYDHTGEGR
jgi:hypothetical protein